MVRESMSQEMRGRKVLDCRSVPGSNCTVAISGTEEEVLKTGVDHAVSSHGYKNTPELREQLRTMMKDTR